MSLRGLFSAFKGVLVSNPPSVLLQVKSWDKLLNGDPATVDFAASSIPADQHILPTEPGAALGGHVRPDQPPRPAPF